MKQSAQSKYREQFNRAIDQAIKECSRKTGITDLETVYQHLKKSASILLKRMKVILAEERIRIAIQQRLKYCTVSPKDAAAAAAQQAAQTEFDFFEMEQFRGIPNRISYVENGKVKYVEYTRSLEWQREASIAHLGKGIDADIARREAEVAGNAWLRPRVMKYGDLEPEKLVILWLRDEQGGTSSVGE